MSKQNGNPSTSLRARVIIVAHAGTGSPTKYSDGTKKATRAALQALKKTHSVIKAAVAGAAVLEDDPRFNAGTGSFLKLDGKTIEMDAAVMDSNNNLGAVGAIQKVKNPVKVAEALINSPHTFMCGEGAIRFARHKGFKEYNLITPSAKKLYQTRIKQIKTRTLPQWAQEKWDALKQGNCDGIYPILKTTKTKEAGDTIGIVVTDGKGNFAVAVSTGGTSLVLPGRVGDTPLIGCGFYAGKCGAVATTGVGEEIMKKMLAKEIYDRIKKGIKPQTACEWGVSLFPKEIPMGAIAVTNTEYGITANQQMASSVLMK